VLPDGRLGAHVGPQREGVNEVLARRVDVDPLAVVAEVRPIPLVRGQGPHREHLAVGGRPHRAFVSVVSCGRQHEETLHVADARVEELVERDQGLIAARRRAEGEHEDVRVPVEGVLQAGPEHRLVVGARDVEGPLDVGRCLRGHTACDSGDERSVPGVRNDDRVAVAVDGIRILDRALYPGEPGVTRGGVWHQPGVHDGQEYALTVAFGPGNATARTAAACVQAGGRDGIHGTWRYLDRLGRGAALRAHVEYVVRRGHPRPEFGVEAVENGRY